MPDLWPYAPLVGVVETHRFNGVVVQTQVGEFRTGHAVDHPVLQMGFYLRNAQLLEISEALRDNATGPWSIPFWPEWQRVTVAAGSTSVTCDPSLTSLQVGSAAVLWQNAERYETVSVDDLDATSITLADATTLDHSEALLIPLVTGLVRQWDRDRIAAPDGARVLAAFEVTDFPDLAEADSGATFADIAGAPVIPRAVTSIVADQGVLSQSAEWILPGTGIVSRVVLRDAIDVTGTLTLNLVGQRQRQDFVRMLARLRGRDGVFWAVEPGGLLEVAAQAGSAVTVAGSLSHLSGRTVLIEGSAVHTVSAAVANADRTVLTLSGAVPSVRSLAVLRQYRLDTNEIAIEHLPPALHRVSVAVKEVP